MPRKTSQKKDFKGMRYAEVQRINSEHRRQLKPADQQWLKEHGYKNAGWAGVIALFQKIEELLDNQSGFEDMSLEDLFLEADRIGQQRYNRLTQQDLADYKKFEQWRYINGDSACGTTPASRDWARENSDFNCPICDVRFSECGGRTIDHKLPRSQYPWLSMDFRNLWVICRPCNEQKAEKHWFEYEHYMFIHHPDRLSAIQAARPTPLLKSLKRSV